MKKTHKILAAIGTLLTVSLANLSASAFFTGYAGGMLNFNADREAEKFDPQMDLSAFFSGQFNFSENLWSHLEFSLITQDLMDQSLFSSTPASFQLDELSLIRRGTTLNGNNYFSIYMGTYDPIGSDIFLQRYFGIEPIGTKLADTYLGLAGSILYPHFGIGIADIVKPNKSPIAYGGYFYLNNENPSYYILNADFRFATSLRYFTLDFLAGIGAPLYDTYKGESTFLVINKLYFHTGASILIGNNYTTSLFIQAGLFNASYEKDSKFKLASDSFYILFEPRFRIKNAHLNLSIYTLPKSTVDKFLFVDETLGADLNVYSDTISIGGKRFTMGIHGGFGLPGRNLFSLFPENKIEGDESNNLMALLLDITTFQFDINVTPYMATEFLGGEINAQVKIKVMDFLKTNWYKAFSAEVGFKTSF